jgi:hypothetical protein
MDKALVVLVEVVASGAARAAAAVVAWVVHHISVHHGRLLSGGD